MTDEHQNDVGPPIYVITDHPSDYPDFYVVRIQWAQRDGTIRRSTEANCFFELWKARAWCEQQGLVCLPRNPNDHPIIVETWM